MPTQGEETSLSTLAMPHVTAFWVQVAETDVTWPTAA